MRTIKLQQKDYKSEAANYQLKLPIDYEIMIPNDDSVRLLSHIMEGMDYKKLYEAYSPFGRKPEVEPKIMCKILVYAYMEGIYSSRKIQSVCNRDVNFMWLLEGASAPDHTTINRFRKERLGEAIEDLFYQFIKILHEIGEVKYENLFIDGTKIEANANKYSFVWKKAIEKNEAKMHLKVAGIAEEMTKLYLEEFKVRNDHIDEDLYKMITFLENKIKIEGIEFVSGSGKRKSNEQKLLEALSEYRERQMDYDGKKDILGDRNSYSKTDEDATFMRMKDDHMKNGQLKAAYNVQLGVENEYIVGVSIFDKANDLNTLIPFLDNLYKNLSARYKNIIADSGYESEENYIYLEEKGHTCYIKPQSYEQSKKRSYKMDISKRENMTYDEKADEYTCYNGKKLKSIGTVNKTTKTGYSSQVTKYECEDCSDCPYKEKCTKSKGNRRLEVAKKFHEKRSESLANINSQQGIILRVNRSIQSEGAFGIIKQDRQFDRFMTRGMNHVTTEALLLCLGFNFNKLHAKIQSNRCGKDLHEVKPA